MKALVRHKFETITQDMNVPFIDWRTGAPLTNAGWSGGPYTLVDDYVPEDPASDFAAIDPTPASAQDPVVEEAAPDTIVIDGVTYTRTS